MIIEQCPGCGLWVVVVNQPVLRCLVHRQDAGVHCHVGDALVANCGAQHRMPFGPECRPVNVYPGCEDA